MLVLARIIVTSFLKLRDLKELSEAIDTTALTLLRTQLQYKITARRGLLGAQLGEGSAAAVMKRVLHHKWIHSQYMISFPADDR
jgi:hypothetical protein